MTTRRSGVLMASAVLSAALVASEPAVALRGGGGGQCRAVSKRPVKTRLLDHPVSAGARGFCKTTDRRARGFVMQQSSAVKARNPLDASRLALWQARPAIKYMERFHQSGVSPSVVTGSINGVVEKLFIRHLGMVAMVAKLDRRSV